MIDWKRTVALRAETDDFTETLRLFLEQAEQALGQGASPDRVQLRALAKAADNLGLCDLARICDMASPDVPDAIPIEVAEIRHSYAASKTAYLTGLTAHMPAARASSLLRSGIRPESRLR